MPTRERLPLSLVDRHAEGELHGKLLTGEGEGEAAGRRGELDARDEDELASRGPSEDFSLNAVAH
jgi:hypothetical protein